YLRPSDSTAHLGRNVTVYRLVLFRGPTSAGEHFESRLHPIGHDRVDAEGEQRTHRFRVVDRPHVHEQIRAMGTVDEVRGDDGNTFVPPGHLQGIDLWPAAPDRGRAFPASARERTARSPSCRSRC